MRFSAIPKAVAIVGLACGLAVSLSSSAEAQKRIKWKMPSAFGSKISIIGPYGPRFTNNVKVMTGGTLNIKFFEPGALVPAFEIWDSVKTGAVESGWTTPGYHIGKIPALVFFASVPFGPRGSEYLGWMFHGGGNDIYDEIYNSHGLQGLRCVAIAPEASGWFRKEIKGPEDLKGLKMRFFGMGAQVMNKLGVSTQVLPGADIYPALERGVIDATEFSMPSIDRDYGYYQIAKHYYFPGWHQQTSVNEVLINKGHWDALSEQHKKIVEVACYETLGQSFIESDVIQADAMAFLVDKGVTLHYWSDEMLALFEEKWKEVLKENMEKDPLFKRAADSYLAFRENYKVWKDHGYLK